MADVANLLDVSTTNYRLRLDQIVDLLRSGIIMYTYNINHECEFEFITNDEFNELKYKKLTDIATLFNMAKNDKVKYYGTNAPRMIIEYISDNKYNLKIEYCTDVDKCEYNYGNLIQKTVQLTTNELYNFIDVFNDTLSHTVPNEDLLPGDIENIDVDITPFKGNKDSGENIKG